MIAYYSVQSQQPFCTPLLAAEVPAVAVEEPPVVPVSAASPVASSVALKVLAASSGASEMLTASSWSVEISTVLYFVYVRLHKWLDNAEREKQNLTTHVHVREHPYNPHHYASSYLSTKLCSDNYSADNGQGGASQTCQL